MPFASGGGRAPAGIYDRPEIDMKDKWIAFLLDILISAAISGVASLVGHAIVKAALPEPLTLSAALSGFILLLLPLILLLLYGGAAIMVIVGLVKRRPGLSLGPVLLIAVLAGFSHVFVALQRASAEAANTRSINADGPMPRTIALDGQSRGCFSPCIQVLATLDRDVVQRQNSERPWERFRRVTGPQCEDDRHRSLTINFVRFGFLGMCAEEVENDAEIDDAIVIGWHDHARGDWLFSSHFEGKVAYVARIHDGTTTVLGRWIEGRIEAPLQSVLAPLLLEPRDAPVGSPIKMEEVYRAAGLRVLDSGVLGPAPIPNLLAELVRLGDTTRPDLGVSGQFKALLKDVNDPIFVANYLAPMLESQDVGTRRLALHGLEILKAKDIEFAKPALARGLMSDDGNEVYRSAFILRRIPSKERDFAIDGLITAVLKHVDERTTRDPLLSLLEEAAHLPGFAARLEAWTPANDQEGRRLAKFRDLLVR